MNVVNIVGTVKYLKFLTFGEKEMASFILLNVDRYTNKEGKEVEVFNYIDCEAWGAICKSFKNVSDGDFIEIFGNLKSFVYESKKADGIKIKKTSINIKSFNVKRKASKQEIKAVDNHISTDSLPYDPDDDKLPF